MRVSVDLGKCQGYANCVAVAPDVFDLADNGLVLLLEEEPADDRAEDVQQAVRLCPVQAIVVEDLPGTETHPDRPADRRRMGRGG
jgi:ferredoxin